MKLKSLALSTALLATLACQKQDDSHSTPSAIDLNKAQQALPVPTNPYLANSPWPMSHQNPYQQGSTPLPGPSSADELSQLTHLEAGYVNITQAISSPYPDGSRVSWGSNAIH